MKPAYLIILLLMNFFWASVYSANKVMGQDNLPTGAIVTLRFALAGLSLLVCWPWLPGTAPRGWDLLKTCGMGVVVYVLGQRLQVYGNNLGTAANSSVLMAIDPLVTSVAAALFLKERLGPRRMAGFVLGLMGVAILNRIWRPDFHWTGLAASLIFVSSFLCEAAYSVIGKPIILRASPMKTLAVSLFAGTAANLAIDGPQTLALARDLSPKVWMLLLYLAVVCTAIGYGVWFIAIRACPVNLVGLTVFAQSVFGALIAAVWLREELHWGHLFGSLAITTGLAVGLSRQIQTPALTE